MTKAGVTAAPATEVETGDTKASGDSDVYPSSTSRVTRCGRTGSGDQRPPARVELPGGWIWNREPDSRRRRHQRQRFGNPHNTGSGLQTTIGHEPFTTIDDDGNSVFVFMGISCARRRRCASGIDGIAEVAFNLVVAIRPTQAPSSWRSRSRRDPPARASLPLGP